MWSVLSYASETDGPQPTLVSARPQPQSKESNTSTAFWVYYFLNFVFKFSQLTLRLPFHTFLYVISSFLLCLEPQLQIRHCCGKTASENLGLKLYRFSTCMSIYLHKMEYFLIKCDYHA